MARNESALWRRADSISNAELEQWGRIIDDPDLKKDIAQIRSKFGLPLSLEGDRVFFEDLVYISWMGYGMFRTPEKTRRLNRLDKKTYGLMRKYRIPSHFRATLFNFILMGKKGTYQTKGFPLYTRVFEDGQFRSFAIITPETDLGNPLVLESLKQWQEKTRARPPRPIKNGRTKDWRAVWEWRSRNPSISDRQLAEMLGLNRVTVSRAMERLDKEHATQQYDF